MYTLGIPPPTAAHHGGEFVIGHFLPVPERLVHGRVCTISRAYPSSFPDAPTGARMGRGVHVHDACTLVLQRLLVSAAFADYTASRLIGPRKIPVEPDGRPPGYGGLEKFADDLGRADPGTPSARAPSWLTGCVTHAYAQQSALDIAAYHTAWLHREQSILVSLGWPSWGRSGHDDTRNASSRLPMSLEPQPFRPGRHTPGPCHLIRLQTTPPPSLGPFPTALAVVWSGQHALFRAPISCISDSSVLHHHACVSFLLISCSRVGVFARVSRDRMAGRYRLVFSTMGWDHHFCS